MRNKPKKPTKPKLKKLAQNQELSLGDGVYAKYDHNDGIWLRASGLLGADQIIYLEPEVLDTLNKHVAAARTIHLHEAGTCKWKYDGDRWITECKREWTFTDGGPVANRMDYCHGCGKPIEVVA